MPATNTPSAPQRPRLLDRVREAIHARHYHRRPADRNSVQVRAAYPGEMQRPSREAKAFPGKGIPTEPQARRSERGCSSLQA